MIRYPVVETLVSEEKFGVVSHLKLNDFWTFVHFKL